MPKWFDGTQLYLIGHGYLNVFCNRKIIRLVKIVIELDILMFFCVCIINLYFGRNIALNVWDQKKSHSDLNFFVN